jgi:hypothetical protein
MIRVTMDDHTGRPEQFEAETYEGVVDDMYARAFLPWDSLEKWMEGMIERHRMWNGSVIRMDTAEHFLTDLDACGSVKLEVLD